VGLGKQGGIRARTAKERDDLVLVCGADPDPPARGFADIAVFHDHRAVLESDVDAVFVCTPNRFTPDVVVAALDAGKHVFCEKPPGRSVADAERMLAAEQRNPGLVLKFGFNHRYHFGIMEAKKIVDSGKYGRVLWLRGIYGKAAYAAYPTEWRQDPELVGGGILLDQGIHMLDLFRHFCGEFTEIKSMCASTLSDTPLEDNAFALLRNDDGCIAMLHSSSTQWKHRFTLEIFLEEGYVIVDGQPSTSRSFRDEWLIESRRGKGFAVGNPPEQATFCNTDPSWEMELGEFVECIRTGQPVRNGTSRDACETMRLVFGIYNADEGFAQRRTNMLAAASDGESSRETTRPSP
ncbi:MAG TPA: Gfo/Idh/MocA family oxidoreductase, partial [Thermoleophilia bacterium]|nr:Gfo/Idh/MocA family oxidoreductase [Thermoleophilia bacterium]